MRVFPCVLCVALVVLVLVVALFDTCGATFVKLDLTGTWTVAHAAKGNNSP